MTEEQAQEGASLSWQDKQMLYFIKEGYTYQEIGNRLRIKTGEAHRRGAEARKHFAALKHIPLETLNLDKYKNHPGRGPRISNTERELLNAYFTHEIGHVKLPADFTDQLLAEAGLPPLQPGELEDLLSDASDTRRQWAQHIEQRRQEPVKRQR
jgi:hypothetical protein